MMQSFEDTTKIGKDMMDNGLKSFAALSKSLQAITAEATEYSKSSYEAGAAAFEKMVSAKSLEKAIEVQTGYAKDAYEGFVSQATKMGDMYADMAKEAYKPFESMMAKAK